MASDMAEQINPTTLKALRRLAELGDADAQFDLGELFHQGPGDVQDDEEAEAWFAKAAGQGHTEARELLGELYRRRASTFLKGRKLERNPSEALHWYKLAAQQGDATAQLYIGRMYENGLGVAKSYLEARSWYLVASRQGFSAADERLAKLEERIRRSKTTWEELVAKAENETSAHLEASSYDPKYQAPEHMIYEIDEDRDDKSSDDDFPGYGAKVKSKEATNPVARKSEGQKKETVPSSPRSEPKLELGLPLAGAAQVVPQAAPESDGDERRILQAQIDVLSGKLTASQLEVTQAISKADIAIGKRKETEARMLDLQRLLDVLEIQRRHRRWWQLFWGLSGGVLIGAIMYALARV